LICAVAADVSTATPDDLERKFVRLVRSRHIFSKYSHRDIHVFFQQALNFIHFKTAPP
jgi:hypothetical protein